MTEMKAFVRTDANSMDIALTEVPVPNVGENEALVEVKAFGVGVHDRYFIPSTPRFPYTIGSEGAGIITQIGPTVTDFKVGDHVILSSSMQPKGGCWAEYVVVPSKNLVQMPNGMDFLEAAALPVAGKTAIECIRTLDLTKGDTLFVAGASGAIGTLIIQLASNKGIRVICSASLKNHDYMKSLGAEMTVDYTNPNWKEEVKAFIPGGVDAALAIQRQTANDSMDVVKDHGKVITVSGDQLDAERGVKVQQFPHLLSFHEALEQLIPKITAGEVQIVIENSYPFEDAIEALTKTETRHARGKLVVKL